ncbi:hypothetical protein ACKI16_23915 [Streptomyces scabiei]|uniref:hypothetical protein n=1 Tax=Streptomyces scabiei TaxID=1930 RepID=UPI0038F60A9D
MSVEQEYVPGGMVPRAPTMAELNASVVFVPLGYGPRVAAYLARRAVLDGVEAVEAYVAVAAGEDEGGPRPESPAPDEGHQGGTGGGQWGA